MIVAVISDVHSNLEALEAVLQDVRRQSAERIWCLGDVVGYGADPVAVCDRLAGLVDVAVAGNHDWAAIGKTGTDYFNSVAGIAIGWTAGRLAPRHREWLASLPLIHLAEDVRLVHATPSAPQDWQYVFDEEDAARELEAYEERLCLIGHSHFPAVFETGGLRPSRAPGERVPLAPGRRYLVNAGSVGQPRDGDPRAAYAIYDTEKQELLLRRVPYDVETAQGKILAAGLPPFLASRLARGA